MRLTGVILHSVICWISELDALDYRKRKLEFVEDDVGVFSKKLKPTCSPEIM